MAKVSRYATARIATTVNARYKSETPESGYYLDGRRAGDRERRGVDVTVDREDRGFFYAVYRTDEDVRDLNSPVVRSLNELTEAAKFGNQNIDNEINDLADAAVQVTGRATLGRENEQFPYFAGVLVKEAEIAAVTTGAGCAYLYRDDILYPLTESDFPLEAIDYNGEPVRQMNDYAAGVAGTIRYSNIAQIQQNDCIILTSADVMEAIGQREMLRLLFEAQDQADAAQSIMAIASAKLDRSVQVMIGFVEYVSPAGKTGKLNLGLFQGGSAHDMNGATTRFEPIREDRQQQSQQTMPEPQYAPAPEYTPDYRQEPEQLSFDKQDEPAPTEEPVEDDLEATKAVNLGHVAETEGEEHFAPVPDEYNLPGEKHRDADAEAEEAIRMDEPAEPADEEKATKPSFLWGDDEDMNFDAYNAGREYARKLNADKDDYRDADYSYDAKGDYDYDRDYGDKGYGEEYDDDGAYAPFPVEDDYGRDYADDYDHGYDKDYAQDDYAYDDRYATGEYRDEAYDEMPPKKVRGAYDDRYGEDRYPADRYDDDGYYDERDDDRYGAYAAGGYAASKRGRYDDEYDDYEEYDEYQDKSTRTKRMILYIILVLICIACVIVLIKMLKGGDDKKPTDTTPSTTVQNNIVIPGADQTQPQSQPQGQEPTTGQGEATQPATTTTTTAPGGQDQPPQGSQTYTIVEGDTMWGIAAKFYPEDKIVEGMAAIREANGRTEAEDTELRIGQVLTIPPLD